MKAPPEDTLRPRILLPTLLAVAACGSPEVLPTYAADTPADVDFSGRWSLNEDPEVVSQRLNRAIRQTAGLERDVFVVRRPDDGRRQQRSSGGLAHVFVENGEQLKITQTPDGIFISFDRAVVEEFRFGENREISVGQVEAQRVSGWEGPEYVVETLGRNGMKVTERYRLSGDRDTLIRKITFRSKSRQEMTVVETFSRQS